ncbi:MAG TPA: type II secretion system secretin GspD [Rhodanobacter sp.]
MSRLPTSARSPSRASLRSTWPRIAALAALTLLAGCASLPPQPDDASLQREAMAGTHAPVPAPLPLNNDQTTTTNAAVLPQISRGNGQFVRPTALAAPRPAVSGANGVTFNFENQPVQAVVKAILGDLLKKNYTIVPGVQGNISFSTAEPVDAGQALPILETLLSWTNNALVERGGSYVVLPAKEAVGGNLVPSLGASAPAGGLQARLFPLHYIAAGEMQKLIKPFARPDAVLLVDPTRNVIVMSGTPEELANYDRTVRTFDVDWLRGMSVGVFNLQHADVDQLMPKLDQMFGPKGDTPLAGMLRFIPIKRTNALVVISTQPNYVDEVGGWIARIDQGGGNQPQLYVYDVRNIKASDLAKYLAQIYASGGSGGSGSGGEVGPGLSSGTLGSAENARGSASGMGSTAGSFGSSNTASGGLGGIGSGIGGMGNNSYGNNAGGGLGGLGGMQGGAASATSFGNANATSQDQQYVSQDGSVRIGSVDANNQLLVRARPSQWAEIEAAIKRLDTIPLQVQIETRILEVNLTGEFQFGVQWYLQGLANSTPSYDANGNVVGATSAYPGAHRQIALGSGGNQYHGEPFFYSFLSSNGKFQAAVRAMETSGNTKTLSAPSLVVMNNQPASIQVGNQVPVNQSYITPGLGTGGSTIGTLGQVQYLNTGVILKVVPRVNPGGLVYLDVSQEVSNPTTKDQNGNYTISDRSMQTQVAVQSGQTVLLGGLIQQDEGTSDTGIPGLNRIPFFGRLFGTTSRNRNRTELIVLITPRVIRSSEEARQITDDYQRGFESLKPLREERAQPAPAPASATRTAPLRH